MTEAYTALIDLDNVTLVELSVQQLVDCATNKFHCGGDGGCNGSTFEIAFDYIK